ncbi:MAG: lipoyl(octanoyl) transferase LipB [Candidatus Eisenbacteria bacterium]
MSMPLTRPLFVSHLGPTPYRDGLALQERLVAARAAGRTGDWLLYPDHPPVLTVGRNPSEGSVLVDRATLAGRGVEVFEVARGGDVTWHGPGQLVGYLVADLTPQGRDLHKFLRGIEQAIIDALACWDVVGERSPGRTGVWVGGSKLASIGVAVRRWVSYHGFALNVAPDLGFFDLIHPCGLRGIEMTSLSRLLGPGAPDLAETRRVVAGATARVFGYPGWVPCDPADLGPLLTAGDTIDVHSRG